MTSGFPRIFPALAMYGSVIILEMYVENHNSLLIEITRNFIVVVLPFAQLESRCLEGLFDILEKMSMVVVSFCLEGSQLQIEWEEMEVQWLSGK